MKYARPLLLHLDSDNYHSDVLHISKYQSLILTDICVKQMVFILVPFYYESILLYVKLVR